MDQLILLLPALPLLSALLVRLLSAKIGYKAVQLSIIGSVLTFVLAAVLLWSALSGSASSLHHYVEGTNWGSLLFDPLSVLIGLVIAGISMVVRIYSVRYMIEEAAYERFFILLDLMTASLLIMVAAGDLVTLLIAWHLVGVLLYFLLGHETRSLSAYRYGFWTFITYRFGDLPLLLAAALLFYTYDTWSLPAIFENMSTNPNTPVFMGFAIADVVGGLIALAAFARSAQFLLHTWLPYTMEGPTPVSALMHAGIVNAGGILINRFAPVYVHTDGVLNWIFLVGLITAIIGSILMLSQNDIKKALGYSTMGQMGFMIMECGVGAFSLAIFHLIAHGLFKGTLFLGAGGVIGEARRHDGVPKDELYTMIIEKRSRPQRQTWLVMAGITLLIPLVVLALSHWLVDPELFKQQGSIVLLFFGWVTGAQLLFAAHRMNSPAPWRLISMIVVSFIIIVLGYTLISHAFNQFLYPDPQFVLALYQAATIELALFDVLVVLIALVIVLGWLGIYYADRSTVHKENFITSLWMNFYALVARELYSSEFFAILNRQLLAFSNRINRWLKWG